MQTLVPVDVHACRHLCRPGPSVPRWAAPAAACTDWAWPCWYRCDGVPILAAPRCQLNASRPQITALPLHVRYKKACLYSHAGQPRVPLHAPINHGTVNHAAVSHGTACTATPQRRNLKTCRALSEVKSALAWESERRHSSGHTAAARRAMTPPPAAAVIHREQQESPSHSKSKTHACMHAWTCGARPWAHTPSTHLGR